MIKICSPYIEEKDNKCFLNSVIDIDNVKKHIWFCVDKEYGKYLCYERSDAFLIGILSYAMRNGHDIVCEAPLSETLYYQLETYLIPSLANNSKRLHRINLIAPIATDSIKNVNAVGTGISGGIDSLSSIITHLDTKFKKHNVTHLMFNNVGSHGAGEEGLNLFHIRLNRIRNFCKDYGFKLIETNSNIHEMIPQNHLLTHTYTSVFAVYTLQKFFSVYYYASSGIKFSGFNLLDNDLHDAANYEVFSLAMFSTDNLRLYSSCSTLSRFEKTKIVSEYEPSYKYLDVCGLHPYSCMDCAKCIRTMFAFDILGKLDKYSSIFDVKDFYNRKSYYISKFYAYYKAHKLFFNELYPYIKSQITLKSKIQALWLYRKNIIRKFMKSKA